jgi:hypothetical protein
MAQNKNTLVYIGLSLFALTGGYLIYKYFKGKSAINEGVKQEVPPQDPIEIVDNSKFPLKKGSKNSYVGQLQSALNVAVDNNFGKDTLAALTAQTGKTQIFSNEDLLTTIDSIKNKVDGKQVARNAAASQILNSKNDYTNLHTTKSTSWKELDLDNNNNYVPTIYIINWSADKNISLSDYEPYEVLPDGYLVIYCNKGGNKGYYKADPLNLYLV